MGSAVSTGPGRGRRRTVGLKAHDARATPAGNIRTTAFGLLGRRDYTTAELTQKLTDRGYDSADVEGTVADLVRDRMLDDRRVAEAHVRTASRLKGRGTIRIRRELSARGIASAIIDEVTRDVSSDDQLAAIGRIVERKTGGRALDPAARRRLFQQLLRRGFPADLIAKALRYKPDDDA